MPRLDEVGIDKTVLLFTALIALATGVVCGLAPALRAFRTDLQETLKSGGRGSTAGRSENRTRALLVISEVALALVLLVGAGLMLRTFQRLQAVDPGFDPHHLLTLEVAAGGKSYRPGPAASGSLINCGRVWRRCRACNRSALSIICRSAATCGLSELLFTDVPIRRPASSPPPHIEWCSRAISQP